MVRCPATSCNQPFETEELRALVDAEAFERWERLTLQKELDQMAVRDPFAQDTLFTPCSHLVHTLFTPCSPEPREIHWHSRVLLLDLQLDLHVVIDRM